MSEPQPILDYASPVSRSSLRLAAKSEIHIDDQGERLIVHEHLAGRSGAIAALGFAAFVVVSIVSIQSTNLERWRKHLEELLLEGGFVIAMVVLAAMVIQQTWRRTVLTVLSDGITLVFAGPMSSTERYNWLAHMVSGVLVIDTRLPPRGHIVAELELQLGTGGSVRLFAGHPKAELDWLAQRISAIVRS